MSTGPCWPMQHVRGGDVAVHHARGVHRREGARRAPPRAAATCAGGKRAALPHVAGQARPVDEFEHHERLVVVELGIEHARHSRMTQRLQRRNLARKRIRPQRRTYR